MMKNLRDMLRYVSPEENEGESTDQNTDNEDPTRKARRWPISRRYMEAALQDICEYNDISEEQLVSAPETIISIEMFLYNFPHICCMSFFPNLVSLSLVQQNLLSIEGLHYCPHLELLRLSENSIQRIEGLGNCLKLKELFLHSNRINRITGVAHLTNLDVLWLSNNEIRAVDGLGDLRLKELSLARNPISQLGEVLNMKELEFLNVSATNIGSFKVVLPVNTKSHFTPFKQLHISITMSSQFERKLFPAPYCVFRFLLSTLTWEVIVLKNVVVLVIYHLHVQWLIQPQVTGM